MRDFLADTNDAYEKRYGKEICVEFPAYGEFWSKYLGYRKDNPLKHYKVDSSTAGIARFDEKYEQMAFAHYGVFLDLSGLIIDIDRLSMNKYTTGQEALEFWNDVRTIYAKMGDTIYKYETFLNYAKDILNIGKVTNSIFKKLITNLEIIKSKRNFIVHFTALPFTHGASDQARKIPRKICDDNGRPLPMGEMLNQSRDEWVAVITQIQVDFKEIKIKFNESHRAVLELFEKNKQFKVIDPGNVEPSNIQSYYGLSSASSDPKSAGMGFSGCPGTS